MSSQLTQGSTGQGGISAQLLSALFGLYATSLPVLQAVDVWPAEHLTGTLFLMLFSRLGPCGLEVQNLCMEGARTPRAMNEACLRCPNSFEVPGQARSVAGPVSSRLVPWISCHTTSASTASESPFILRFIFKEPDSAGAAPDLPPQSGLSPFRHSF